MSRQLAGDHSSNRFVVCVAPILPTDVRQYTLALAQAGLLRAVVCGLAYHERSAFASALRLTDSVLGTRWYGGSEARRVDSEFPPSTFHPSPWADVASRVATKMRLRRQGPITADRVPTAVDRRATQLIVPTDRLVVGREDGCLRAFRTAQRIGAVTLYDLPTAHYSVVRRTIDSEEAQFPEAKSLTRGIEEYARCRTVRKDLELATADHVLVASQFVRTGLIGLGVSPDRVTAVPYGCDQHRLYRSSCDRKPVVLYVGRVSLPKGVCRLLKVWKRLGAARTHTLRLIGKMMLPPEALDGFAGTYDHVPAVPRSQLWEHYSTAQAFVFPSACDGFGLVVNEALSCGTPVIASSNTGAPGFITNRVQGLIYQHGDDDALAAHLDWMLSHPCEVAEMGREAYELAQRWGWPHYRAAIRSLVARLLPNPQTLSEDKQL